MKIIGTRRAPRPAQPSSYGVDANNKDTTEPIGDAGPSFPCFSKLPAEIRNQIWELYCPDLSGCPRVFNLSFRFKFLPFYGRHRLCITEDRRHRTPFPLTRQTRALRHLSAVHKATRDRVLSVAPDVFHLLIPDEDTGELVQWDLRFHAFRDIIVINSDPFAEWEEGPRVDITGVAKNVAVSARQLCWLAPHFTNVTTVYLLTCSCNWPLSQLTWCAAPATQFYEIEWGKPLPSWLSLRGVRHWALGGISRFCFPDKETWSSHACPSSTSLLQYLVRQMEGSHVGMSNPVDRLDLRPMVVFKGESHMKTFDQLLLLSDQESDA